MKYIKSFKFWIIFLISIYSFVGFIALPWFVTNKLPTLLNEKIGLHVNIKKSSFNPFSMEFSLSEIELNDLQNQPALKIKKVYLNYSPLALLDGSIFIKDFELENPQVFATLYTDGKINFQNIIPPNEEDKKEEQTAQNKTELPKIVLNQFKINKGEIFFKDEKKDFNLELGPYDFSLHDLSTQEGMISSHNFVTKIQTGGEIRWEGGVSLEPLQLYGTLELEEVQLPTLVKYAINELPTHLDHGKISLKLPYQIDLTNGIEAKINEATLNLKALMLTYKNEPMIDISNIEVQNINLAYPSQSASIQNVFITRPTINANTDENYTLNLLKALKMPASETKEEENMTKQSKPWNFIVKNISSSDGKIKFTDLKTNSYFEIANMEMKASNISSDKDEAINYEANMNINELTHLSVQGDFLQSSLKATSNINLSNLKIAYFKNYVEPFVNINIQDGDIDMSAKVDANLAQNKTKVLANTYINKLLISTNNQEPVLSWEKFAINQITFEQNPMALDIGAITLEKPFVKLQIAHDGSTNFTSLVKEQPNNQAEQKKTKENKLSLKMRFGEMKLKDAKADFSDLSLPFPFHTKIHSLNGDFSELDLQKAKPSKLLFEGKINEFGYTKIEGSITPLAIKEYANIDVKFKNVDLTSMTPYSGKFVGYKIDSGKISMDLKYSIDNASLKGSNKINIDTLNLGEKVDSPDAVNLPLGLAIALLKDSNGQIDIDLPVAGDMNNPEFSYGAVIWRAVGNLITGIVTAPFRFLGNMLGIDGDKLKSIDFALGQNAIIITEQEKLQNLEKLLGKRPGIKISITGSYDENLDKKALQEKAFQAIVEIEQKDLAAKVKDKKADIYSLALKSLYLKSFDEKAYEKMQESFIDKKTEKLDIASLNKAIFKMLSEKMEISKEALQSLATQRAEAVKKELETKYKIDAQRIILKEVESSKAVRDEWIEVKLDITS